VENPDAPTPMDQRTNQDTNMENVVRVAEIVKLTGIVLLWPFHGVKYRTENVDGSTTHKVIRGKVSNKTFIFYNERVQQARR
jgi:hypothetical protein